MNKTSQRSESHPTARAIAAVGLALALVTLAACGGDDVRSSDAVDDFQPFPTTSPKVRILPPDDQATGKPSTITAELADPASVSIPAVGLNTRLEALHLDKHRILVPPHYGIAGWYQAGPEPGEPGVSIIAGHLDSKVGPDTFYNLGRVKVGDRVLVHLVDHTTKIFRIFKVHQYPVKNFPAASVYRETTGSELRMVTCAGSYDHGAGRYRDNLVVFAKLVR